jgi:hypothetical protein
MSNPGAKMGLRRQPYAFTEHGGAMLSSVLRCKRAVEIRSSVTKGWRGRTAAGNAALDPP